ncbi:hypothetical protein BH10BAC3_BH10BAC3_36160 [soil metagenome]
MSVKIIKNSATELIITQQKKLTVTGSVFCLPVISLLFYFPNFPAIILTTIFFVLLIIMLCFYRGVTYVFKADKTAQTLEVAVKNIFRHRKNNLSYQQVHHVIMAESDRFLQSTANCHYHIIIETSTDKRLRLFGFKNRATCKKTAALIESYL